MDENTLIYNALDSAITLQVARGFWKELDENYQGTYDFTINLLEPLIYMQERGIAVSHELLSKARVDGTKRIREVQAQLDEMVGKPLNVNSPKQMIAYFYYELGIPPYTKPNAKKERVPTTDDKALARLARGTSTRKPLPQARLCQELRSLIKLQGTYLEMTFDEDGRFRCSVNPRGTWSGRLSTGKTIRETGMNMQNLPVVFKSFLVPDPGYIMFEIDKAQAEWVVVAYSSGDANMMSILEEGGDPHIHTAHLAFRCDKELIKLENKLVGHSTDALEIEELRRQHMPELYEDGVVGYLPRVFSMRQGGKKSNHALNYGETYKMFALSNEISEAAAKPIVEAYHRVYPGIKRWYERIQHQLGIDRTLVNPYGRRRRFQERWGDDLFKAAYSYIPQSTVADLINNALLEVYHDDHPSVLPFELLGQVHDSVVYQAPISMGIPAMAEGLARIRKALDPTLEIDGREFKIGTDCKASVISWADMEDLNFSGTDDDIKISLENFIEQQKAKGLVDGVPKVL